MTELHATLHEEDGMYWAEVQELPGCFASGRTLEELREAIIDAISLYLDDNGNGGESSSEAITRAQLDEMRLDEMRFAVPVG